MQHICEIKWSLPRNALAVMEQCMYLCLLLLLTGITLSKKPNFLYILVDDLGFGNVNFNRDVPSDEIRTPNMDRLAITEGLRLMRHYVYPSCSPTRCSFQSGRLPVHVQDKNHFPDQPNSGIPRNMTGIATKMQMGGYQTHFAGKWVCSILHCICIFPQDIEWESGSLLSRHGSLW